MTSQFRAPTSEMPEWIYVKDDVLSLYSSHILGTDLIVYTPAEAEALLRALLEVCPNAAEIVGAWARAELVRTKLAEFKETMQGQTIPEIERVMDERAEAAVKARQTIVKDTP